MKMKISSLSLITLSILVFSAGAILSQSLEEEKKKAGKPMAFDKGATSIDVSGYPKKYQGYYKIFKAKCGKCHTLARPINAPYKANTWKRYVKRMMRKPGSGISSSDGKKIYLFLKYYSSKKK